MALAPAGIHTLTGVAVYAASYAELYWLSVFNIQQLRRRLLHKIPLQICIKCYSIYTYPSSVALSVSGSIRWVVVAQKWAILYAMSIAPGHEVSNSAKDFRTCLAWRSIGIV